MSNTCGAVFVKTHAVSAESAKSFVVISCTVDFVLLYMKNLYVTKNKEVLTLFMCLVCFQ